MSCNNTCVQCNTHTHIIYTIHVHTYIQNNIYCNILYFNLLARACDVVDTKKLICDILYDFYRHCKMMTLLYSLIYFVGIYYNMLYRTRDNNVQPRRSI